MKLKGLGGGLMILKLGGSVITRKEVQTPALNQQNLDRISREISESSYGQLIIVHGAGSFGHPYAKKYEIGHEIENQIELEKKQMGFSIIQDSVKRLNSSVCEYLRKYGINPVSIQPSSFIITENKRIYSADLQIIKRYLDMGLVPVLYGDVVLDREESIKMAILSGDQIVKYLAENLKPSRVILASDVDGIYDRDPKKYGEAQLMEVVTSLDQLDQITDQQSTDQSKEDQKEDKDKEWNNSPEITDVTGGMGGKLKELIELADMGVESEIINANHDNIIKKAINGEKVTGTLITKNKKVKK